MHFSNYKNQFLRHANNDTQHILNEEELVDDIFATLGLRSRDVMNNLITALSHKKPVCVFRCLQNHLISQFLVTHFTSLVVHDNGQKSEDKVQRSKYREVK